jgi:hypothetical protein
MEHSLFFVDEKDGISVEPTEDGQVRVDATFAGTRLRSLLTDMEGEEVCEALWKATLEARAHFNRRRGLG